MAEVDQVKLKGWRKSFAQAETDGVKTQKRLQVQHQHAILQLLETFIHHFKLLTKPFISYTVFKSGD